MQHAALDAATQGFEDALTAAFGDNVTFDFQNAQGDSATCATITNGFVSSGVDLIMANATPALQAAQAATNTIPVLGTSVTEYGVALGLDNFSGTVGGNVSGTSDLAPLDQQADMIVEWMPDAKKVGLLYCSAEANSQYQVDEVQKYLEAKGVTATQYAFSDSNDLSSVCQKAADENDALYVPTDNTVAANTGIGIVQQIKSKRTIEKLTLLSEAKVPTVRDGKLTEVHSRELVRSDVIELSSGSQIPADAEVLSGQVQVNEGLITGEADAIPKAAGDTLLSGSFVISGRCRARLTKVGAESYAAKLTLAAKREGGAAQSEMMRSLNALIRFIGIALIPIGAALFYNQYVIQDLGLRQSMVSMVAALIGMIPEGLFLLTSVALALSVVRLAQNKTLIHEMNAVETLARVDVLCVDKTGTVTLPEMELREVLPLDEAACPKAEIEDTLGAFYRVMEADNDTARAIQKRYPSGPYRSVKRTVPFTSATKWSAVAFGASGSFFMSTNISPP